MSDVLLEKWDAILNSEKVESIQDTHKKRVTAQLLENQEKALNETASAVTGDVAQFNPVMISLVRRMAPKLIAYDIAGVQALTMPTGLIFALKSRYTNGSGAEALGLDEADTDFSGTGTHQAQSAWASTYGTGIATATAEAASPASMGLTIEKVTVTAKTRQLRADFSVELSQDLKAVHGLDAESELSTILVNEITAEINREVVRSIYKVAKPGAQWTGITAAGTFDLSTDSDGRYNVEKFKGLFYAMQRDANAVALESRRGKANFAIVSSDVASALALAGVLEYAPALDAQIKLEVDPAGVTYAGTMGGIKIYIDPYAGFDFYVLGYKGSSPYDAGLFFCPYIPLQQYKATDPTLLTPVIAFKTRYGIIENPFCNTNGATLVADGNFFYRKTIVTGLSSI